MNLPKLSKDQIKKLSLSAMGFVFLLYVYFTFFLGPLHKIRDGASIRDAEQEGRSTLLGAGFDSVDYVAVRDARTLKVLRAPAGEMRILAAATIAATRLIDNMPV